jgi:CRP-like cAMP-binding protein
VRNFREPMKNRLLKTLPAKELRIIVPQLRPVDLVQGAVLYGAGETIQEIYFPEEATVSFLAGTAEGETLEICVVGNEGVVGVAGVFKGSTAFRAVVQLPGKAFAVSRRALQKEFSRGGALHQILLSYSTALLVQIAQTAVCNKFHSVEERFCRWLLMAHDRSAIDEVPLTQEALARLLGSRRASVSVAAGQLQRRGAIRYSRGVIQILRRERLAEASCECYETIAAAHASR